MHFIDNKGITDPTDQPCNRGVRASNDGYR